MNGMSRRVFLAAAALREPELVWLDVTGGPLPAGCWERQGDALHALAPRQAFHDLRSEREFGDFEFRFEFKLAPGANSGVKYLLYRIDEWQKQQSAGTQARARGFEFQLIDDGAEDARKDPAHVNGALYGILPPSKRTPGASDGRFHAAMIRRRGARVEHHIDGTLVLEASLDSPEIAARCRSRKIPAYPELAGRKSAVALQHHNSEVWFRRMSIQSL